MRSEPQQLTYQYVGLLYVRANLDAVQHKSYQMHNIRDTKQNFNRDRVEKLILSAMIEFIDFLKSRSHEDLQVHVFSPQQDGNQFQNLIRPDLNNALLGYQDECIKLPVAVELIDYVQKFGHGMKVSKKFIPKSNKTVYHQLVSLPLWKWWSVKSIEALSLDKVWIPWKLSNEELNQIVKVVLNIELENASHTTIIAPFLGIELQNVDKIKLADNVELRAWTQADKAVYFYENRGHLPTFNMISQSFSKCYLQVTTLTSQVFIGQAENRNQLEEFVCKSMSRAKWVLMQVINPENLIEELLVTTSTDDTYCYAWFSPFQRYSGRVSMNSSCCIFTEDDGEKAAKFLKDLEVAVGVFPDLEDILWRFDRATLASLPRDILFESTVGLESLLVNGSGESTRRFRTYGVALIGDGKFDETSKNLNKIYSLRSSNAHSSTQKLENVEELSRVARSYFVRIIANVVHLVVAGQIMPLIKDGKRDKGKSSINQCIESYLTSLMYGAAQSALQESTNSG